MNEGQYAFQFLIGWLQTSEMGSGVDIWLSGFNSL